MVFLFFTYDDLGRRNLGVGLVQNLFREPDLADGVRSVVIVHYYLVKPLSGQNGSTGTGLG